MENLHKFQGKIKIIITKILIIYINTFKSDKKIVKTNN